MFLIRDIEAGAGFDVRFQNRSLLQMLGILGKSLQRIFTFKYDIKHEVAVRRRETAFIDCVHADDSWNPVLKSIKILAGCPDKGFFRVAFQRVIQCPQNDVPDRLRLYGVF